MVVTQTFINNAIKESVRTLSVAQLGELTPDQLVAEQARTQKDLRALEIMLEQYPRWLEQAPNLRRYKNALYREQRRIGKELDRRATLALSDRPSVVEQVESPLVEVVLCD